MTTFYENIKKYTYSFIALFFIVLYWLIFFIWNPFSVNEKFKINVYFGFISVIFLGAIVTLYDENVVPELLKKGLLGIVGYLFLFLFFIFLFYLITTKDIFSKIYYTIIKIVLIIGLVAILYYFFMGGKSKENMNIMNRVILYLPCLYIEISEWFQNNYFGTSRTLTVMIFIELSFLFLYIVTPIITNYFMNLNKTLLLKEPEYINKKKVLGKFEDLYKDAAKDREENKHDYSYSLSFWFWITPQPPSTSVAYTKFSKIISYGNKPALYYNGMKNKLRVTCLVKQEVPVKIDQKKKKPPLYPEIAMDPTEMKLSAMNKPLEKEEEKEEKEEYETVLKPAEKIIYETNDFDYQKWNQMVITYDKGTMDVFMNGELVGTRGDVVPYMTYDSIILGEEKGIHGGISNVSYHETILSKNEISSSYIILKNNNIPIL